MTLAEIIAKVDELSDLARLAGKDYDYLTFKTEELHYDKDGASGTLGAILSALETDLAQMALDLRTLPVVV